MLKYGTVNEKFDIRDSVNAVVVGGCSSGVFLELDSGESAFAYFGSLHPGTEVICTIRGRATNTRRVQVEIDSVMNCRLIN